MKKIFFGITALAASVALTSCAHKTIVPPQPEQLTNTVAQPEQPGSQMQPQQPMLPATAAPIAPSKIGALPAAVPTTGQPLAGEIERSMDDSDKDKLSHALDKRIGKKTEWTNNRTHITYTVIPTRKLVIDGNHFCRKYQVISEYNGAQREVDGTACVSGVDSSWQVVK